MKVNFKITYLFPATSFIPANLKYDELKKLVQLIIKINRQEGAGLGIRIAGGKGSNPYKEDDEVAYFYFELKYMFFCHY